MIASDGPMQLPAHLAGANFGVTTNLMEGMFAGGNRIGLKGSRFRLVVNGIEEGVIQEPYLDTIFLGAAPAVSRVYYEGAYKPGENQPPTCYSADGITPADDVKAKQSDKCMTCPMNAKGSKIVDGQSFKACSYFRRVVVMLAGDTTDRRVFKLDVKAQGLFGEGTQNEKNLNDYIKMIATRGVDAGAVVTRISFDTDSSVPKLLFKAVRFITEDEMHAVSDLVQSDEVANLKNVSMSTLDASHEEPTNGDATPETAPQQAAAPQRPQAVQRPQAAAQQPVQAQPQRPQAVQRPAPATQAQQPQRPQAAVKVDSGKPIPQNPRNTTQAAAAQPQPQVQEVDSDDELADILSGLE